jgi:NAD(P)-dependent dehydrogenase (short-subunit alcohol dehydrogenase family)
MNRLDLNGHNAVVTGGASGLGFAIAKRLIASGAKVVIWDLDREAGEAAGKQLGGSSIAADVSDLTSVTSALQKTLGVSRRSTYSLTTPESAGPTRSCGSIRSTTGRESSQSMLRARSIAAGQWCR